MVLDTGASRSILDEQAIHDLGLQSSLQATKDEAVGIGNDNMEAKLIQIHELRIGKIELRNWPIGVFDLGNVNQTYQSIDLPAVAGLLGNDILIYLQAKIDYKRRQVRFWPPKS